MKARRAILATLLYVILIGITVIMIFPFIWAFTASFKMSAQIFNGNPFDLIPKPFTWHNYERAWTVLPFYRFLLNSVMLSLIVPTGIIILASLSAYSFARLNFKGRDIVFMLLLGVMMMPGHITLIPNYSLMRMLGWINDYKALIVPMMFQGSLVFNIFFMRQYFLSIPKELDEAAIIDGCSRFGVWWRIIMPNARPALATIAILSFVSEWNTFLWPVIVINDYLKMPIQVGISYFRSNVNDWGVLMAATSMAIIPLVIVFAVFQKHFIKSMLTSGLSGK
ncbi:carbohydrate ABC transporter permease [Paenibacillus koleovorans]|uniref:carbohydrate ABC transporter permease n=1 Tax=Paenibacillus koleovorans TaxID=121608 RepID=UPI000FDB6CF1|nr:carbohydrate ABC transporter permease [Paenibacillus koleovorans]